MKGGVGDSEFVLPVAYWPARTAGYFWSDVRLDEVRKELDLAAAAGIRVLHLQLPWDACQADNERVDVEMMRALEAVLGTTADAGITAIVSVAVADCFGQRTLPNWSYEITMNFQMRPMRTLRRLYEDPVALRCSVHLVQEVVGEFAQHPAVRGWIVGDGMMSATPARSAENVAEWLELVLGGLPTAGRPLWHGVSARDVVKSKSLVALALAKYGVGFFIRLDWQPDWVRHEETWAPFLVLFTRALGGLPPLVTDTSAVRILSNDAPEEATMSAISDVHSAGGAGLIWPSLFNYDENLRATKLFRGSTGEMRRGLFTAHGRFSAAAAAWLDASNRSWTVNSPVAELLDEELRSRDPEDFARTAYLDFSR